MNKYLVMIGLTLLCSFIAATTITVNIDGTGQFTRIQDAIVVANNGDTVLVSPGRYFENVDFLGKSITVCSLEATSGDSTYIASTIIDGNNSGSCVRFLNQEQSAILRGFTLEHGTGYLIPRGILVGGGIYIYANCNVTVVNCDIKNNHSSEGAGIWISKGSVTLSGVKIHDNYATSMTAGLYVYSFISAPTSITFDPINRCSIYNNYSGNPCDIAIIDVMTNLDIYLDLTSVAQLSNFYYQRNNNFQYTQGYHDTIYSQRAYRVEVNHDLYVSPSGNDSNSGLSPAEAMKSITKAVHRIASDSLDIKTVHVLSGTYSESEDDQIFPIPCKSYIQIKGTSSEVCTLFTNQTLVSIEQYVFVASKLKNIAFSGFRISIPTDINRNIYPIHFAADYSALSDIIICDTNVHQWGAIKMFTTVNVQIDHVILRNIQTPWVVFTGNDVGGSISNCIFENISSTLSDPNNEGAPTMFDLWAKGTLRVENCVFRNFLVPDMQPTLHISDPNQPTGLVDISVSNCIFDNLGTDNESPISFNNRNVENFQVNNCTFINNRGATGAVGLTGRIYMKNNIFYNPASPFEMNLFLSAPYGIDSHVYLDYNNIRGGESAVYNPYSNNHVYYSDTNISSDPAFISLDPASPQYAMLSETSPCINSGTPDITELNLLPYDLAGNWRVWDGRIDMGCYEYGSLPWVTNDDPIIPAVENVISATNYPNPFNPSTTIAFSLPLAGIATVEIYNLKGQKVRSLLHARLPSGDHKAIWDGSNDNNQPVSSGIYFYRINSGKQSRTGKMILAK